MKNLLPVSKGLWPGQKYPQLGAFWSHDMAKDTFLLLSIVYPTYLCRVTGGFEPIQADLG